MLRVELSAGQRRVLRVTRPAALALVPCGVALAGNGDGDGRPWCHRAFSVPLRESSIVLYGVVRCIVF